MDVLKLVSKARKGNDEAFERLIGLYQHQLYRTAYMYAGNQEEALRIVQDTICEAYISFKDLKKLDYFLAWLTRILLHHAYRAKQEIDEMEGPDSLQGVLMQLDENYQTVILLSYYYDLPIDHIAWHLNVSEVTVSTYMRNVTKLLPHLEEGGILHGQKKTY
ncbi:sigma factor-like helix-turn-helix DNA-binding protein [Priestia taiwanensis]|uniref:DNA-directed RNA polymerase sigma-70 factor n=1 Tax=Priestia taiwanensis TaxID=1347902 RepID=A0A917AVV3_9BACI|nr:sigma factor-like helix-turn-helix DNA-binding protein [Priestia taiwanensis]MBM7364490.1 RNA polymerase sigma-70 factor (ECF subfamily) [Priestia taiwanensis]GGE81066.1 DNA-directed RNA polymerase sigma-70 factor [Priestia taiwanensis]